MMKGLSEKEVEIISWLEFHEEYFFSTGDIERFSKNKKQRYNTIQRLMEKKRIIKLNRQKYYLIPMKAKSGSWAENSFIVVDEMMDGQGYVIGGWAAAHYWKLTEQVPMQIDVYTTRRQGKIKIFNMRMIFHRTTKAKVKRAISRTIAGHAFKVLRKEESKKWLQSRL
jgi:predicted transcriptional regulator of viral defense system